MVVDPLAGRSMRARITLLATLISTVALVAGSVLLVTSLDRSLTRSGDDLSRSRARDLADQLARGTLPPTLVDVGDEGVAQVVGPHRRVLAASANIEGAGPISSLTPTGGMRVTELVAPDDHESEHYRVWAVSAHGPTGPATVYVGTSLESVAEATRTVRRSLYAGVPALLVVLAGLTWLLTGRTLQPVESIRRRVETISATQLDRRVPVPDTGDEVARLAETMNTMLARLEQASLRERAFVADASHELQSPLTSLRAQLEIGAGSAADWQAIARAALGDVEQLEQLVHNLLFLAHAGAVAPVHRLLDLDDLVLEEADRVRSSTPVAVDTTAVSAAPVRGDAGELRRAVRNVLENAVRHAESSVQVSVDVRGPRTLLVVADDGPGVPTGDRDRIFERFVTLGRGRATGGSGLGLAIARSVAERHGGTVRILETSVGAAFELDLPSAD